MEWAYIEILKRYLVEMLNWNGPLRLEIKTHSDEVSIVTIFLLML